MPVLAGPYARSLLSVPVHLPLLRRFSVEISPGIVRSARVRRVRTASGWYRDEAEPSSAGGRLAILAGAFIAGALLAALLIFWFLVRTPRRGVVRMEPPVPREMIRPMFFYGSLTGGFAGLTAAGFYLVWFRRQEQRREERGEGGDGMAQ